MQTEDVECLNTHPARLDAMCTTALQQLEDALEVKLDAVMHAKRISFNGKHVFAYEVTCAGCGAEDRRPRAECHCKAVGFCGECWDKTPACATTVCTSCNTAMMLQGSERYKKMKLT